MRESIREAEKRAVDENERERERRGFGECLNIGVCTYLPMRERERERVNNKVEERKHC